MHVDEIVRRNLAVIETALEIRESVVAGGDPASGALLERFRQARDAVATIPCEGPDRRLASALA